MKQDAARVDALPAKAVRMVRERLAQIAAGHEVCILHAIESGSRAWGFPSPDSDPVGWTFLPLNFEPKHCCIP